MTARLSLRPARQKDLTAIESLAAEMSYIRWGWRLSAKLLAQRWQRLSPTLIRVAESTGVVQGYSDYQPSPTLPTFHGVASNLDVARTLIHWACEDAACRGTTLQTSLFAKEAGQTLRPDRRKGLGEALTRAAVRSLGHCTITLIVLDDNPARRLYERLGFAVWEERLDLVLDRHSRGMGGRLA